MTQRARATAVAMAATAVVASFAGCGPKAPEIAGNYNGDRAVNLMLSTGSMGMTGNVTSAVTTRGHRAAIDMEDCAFEVKYDGDGIFLAENVTCMLLINGNMMTLGPADGTFDAPGDGTIYIELSGDAVDGDSGGVGIFTMTYNAFQL